MTDCQQRSKPQYCIWCPGRKKDLMSSANGMQRHSIRLPRTAISRLESKRSDTGVLAQPQAAPCRVAHDQRYPLR